MKYSHLILLALVFSTSCQHRTPASSEASGDSSSYIGESCSAEAAESFKRSKVNIAKAQFMDLFHLIRKNDRTRSETLEIQSRVRKWQNRSFTQDGSPAFSNKIFNELKSLKPAVVYIEERELIDKVFNSQDHSIELIRYQVNIRETTGQIYSLKLLCQFAYNCLNTQGGKSLCSIEEP